MRCQPSSPTRTADSGWRELICEVSARAKVDLPDAGIPAMPTTRRDEMNLVKVDCDF